MNHPDGPERATVGSGAVPHPDDQFFTIVAVPDTQVYSEGNIEPFEAQTRWIGSVRDEERIAVVLHEGDLVNGPAAEAEQYQRAERALRRLDDAEIPYLLTIGNHDYNAVATRNAADFESRFPVSRFESRDWWHGCYRGTTYNAAAEIEIGEETLLALSIELFPRTDVIEWANQTIDTHPGCRVAVVTHGYLHNDGTRISDGDNWTRQSYDLSGHNGDELWEAFIRRRPEIEFVISGHALIGGNAHLQTPNNSGAAVHQFLTNYQSLDGGGQGYLTLLRVYPGANVLTVETFSPSLNQFHPDPALHYRIDDAFGHGVTRPTGRFVRHRG